MDGRQGSTSGKSQLFEAVFPKGTTMETKARSSDKPVEGIPCLPATRDVATYLLDQEPDNDDRLDVGALLPPRAPRDKLPRDAHRLFPRRHHGLAHPYPLR